MNANRAFTRRAPRGRHAQRHGASMTGQMSTWTRSIVGQVMSEMEKRRVEDRSLDLYTNDAMAHGMLESMTAEAVGIGLTPQLTPDAAWLGLSEDWLEEYQTAGWKTFERWGLGCRCFSDAQARLNFYGQQALAYFHWKLFGIGLSQVVYKKRPGSPLSLALLPIDPYRLQTPVSASKAEIYNGVQVDSDGMPEKVHLNMGGYGRASIKSFDVWDKETGLPKILMTCGVRNVAEYREDGVLGSMIKELRNNQDFVDAALVRALIANMFVMNITQGSATPLGTEFADRFVELEQAMIMRTLPNEDVRFLSNDAPGPNFEKMFDSIVARLGMATSRGPENVARKFNTSYTAGRMAHIKAQEVVEAEQQLTLNVKFSGPALSWMLYAAALDGRIPVKSIKHFRSELDDYTRAEWLPQPAKDIDPLKSANARKVDMAIGALTQREVWAAKGKNWKEQREQIYREAAFDQAMQDKYGVVLPAADAKVESMPDDKEDKDAQADD